MDGSIYWNFALCNLVPSGSPFMQMSNGMASACPLNKVTLFHVQLTRRNMNPLTSSIYVPLTYDSTQNNLCVYIPPRLESTANALPYIVTIDSHLKQSCEQFRASGNQGCVIYYAIRQLISIPNLTSHGYV